MKNLLIELLIEEMPYKAQKYGEKIIHDNLRNSLKENNIEFDNSVSFSTPRRLAFKFINLPLKQKDALLEKRGPKLNAPEQAIKGFLKSVELENVKELDIKDGAYLFKKEVKGKLIIDILPEIISSAINKITWAKSMRFARERFKWIRPLKNIVVVLGDELVRGEFNYLDKKLNYSNKTLGHRFMSDGKIKINANNYEEILEKENVLVDSKKRKKIIQKNLEDFAKKENIELIKNERLLDEVTGLVEYPNVLGAKFDDKFLKLPKEVIITSMEKHQKFFAFKNNNNLSPYFATVSNIKTNDNGKAILNGNGRVLKARLEDSVFFYENDLKNNLEDNNEKLKSVVFHEKLGSVYDRVERIIALSMKVAEKNSFGLNKSKGNSFVNDVGYAAKLCKADLVSELVLEFPNLQGIIGAYIAQKQGIIDGAIAKKKDDIDDVIDAIKNHYKPVGSNDEVPTNPVTICVSLVEKIDTLVGFWLIDEVPTSSKDPYALRRAALGIIRIILENKIDINLEKLIDKSVIYYTKMNFENATKIENYLYKEQRNGKIRSIKEEIKNTSDDVGIAARQKQINDLEKLEKPKCGLPTDTREIIKKEEDKRRNHINMLVTEAIENRKKDLLNFIKIRTKIHLKSIGFRHDIIDSINDYSDLKKAQEKIKTLNDVMSKNKSKIQIIKNSYLRILNILGKNIKINEIINVNESTNEYTKKLVHKYDEVFENYKKLKSENKIEEIFLILLNICPELDDFFDNVFINDTDDVVKKLNISILNKIKKLFFDFADFSKITND